MVTKKSEATDSSADALEAILTKLGAMEAKIGAIEDKVEEASQPPPLTTDMGIENSDPYGESNLNVENRYINASGLLKKGDVVRLRDDSEKSILMRKNAPEDRADVIEAQGILGTVEGFLHTHERTGEPKFRVKFVGFGTDGVEYRDLELVNRK